MIDVEALFFQCFFSCTYQLPCHHHQILEGCSYLLFSHPALGLLGISVEELQIHALFVGDTSLFPQLFQGFLLISQSHKLKNKKNKQNFRNITRNIKSFSFCIQVLHACSSICLLMPITFGIQTFFGKVHFLVISVIRH